MSDTRAGARSPDDATAVARVEPPDRRLHRRGFLAWGGIAATGLILAGCGDDDEPAAEGGQTMTVGDTTMGEPVVLDFSNDVGVANYAYALEQLEAAFYAEVNANIDALAGDLDDGQRAALGDIAAHEAAHRDFLVAVLAENAIGALTPDFSAVDFTSAESVLQTAATFENLGVAAYNGAGALITPDGPLGVKVLVAAGSIVSVEARHAATINRFIGESFAPGAFDAALSPSEVLAAADPFIATPIMATNLPATNGNGG